VLHQSQHTAVNLRIRITAADDRITSGSDPRERSPSCHACYRSNTKDLTRSLISICVPERLWRRESITCEARLFLKRGKMEARSFP
jgi:seryl-tRNA(Sec) selenium transferase